MKKFFTISLELYSIERLMAAAEDFAQYAMFHFEEESSDSCVMTIEADDDVDLIFHEFMNYVLS